MGSWNVAGVAVDAVDAFVEQLSDNYTWDIIMLQEGFRQNEGVPISGGHLLFTSGHLVGNLRCPAILVHERWTQDTSTSVKLIGSGKRWVAVELKSDQLCYVFMSVHLPHCRLPLSQYTETLDEITRVLGGHQGAFCILGLDANVGMEGVVDYVHVGPSVLGSCYCRGQQERASSLHNFLSSHGLCLSNTFADGHGDDLVTRKNGLEKASHRSISSLRLFDASAMVLVWTGAWLLTLIITWCMPLSRAQPDHL